MVIQGGEGGLIGDSCKREKPLFVLFETVYVFSLWSCQAEEEVIQMLQNHSRLGS